MFTRPSIFLTFLLSFFLLEIGIAQDFHFSQAEYQPLLLSPSNTGNFYGNIRVGSAYREQWRRFITAPYRTLALFVDGSIDAGFGELDWVSLGMSMAGDQSGDLTYGYNAISVSAAYHRVLDKRGNSVLTIGFDYGTEQHILDNSAGFIFGDELAGSTQSSTDRDYFQNFSGLSKNIGLGLSYLNISKSGNTFEVMASCSHLNRAKFNTLNTISPRINAAISYKSVVNKRLWLRVNAAGSKQSVATQLNLNGALGYRLLEDSEFALVPGIGLRVGDAILFRLGVETSDWAASFAYDITYSSARLYNQGQGAYELGFYKIFKIHKRPRVLPVLLCPRF